MKIPKQPSRQQPDPSPARSILIVRPQAAPPGGRWYSGLKKGSLSKSGSFSGSGSFNATARTSITWEDAGTLTNMEAPQEGQLIRVPARSSGASRMVLHSGQRTSITIRSLYIQRCEPDKPGPQTGLGRGAWAHLRHSLLQSSGSAYSRFLHVSTADPAKRSEARRNYFTGGELS